MCVQSEWLRSKSLQVINAGEGVEKREPAYTVGGNVLTSTINGIKKVLKVSVQAPGAGLVGSWMNPAAHCRLSCKFPRTSRSGGNPSRPSSHPH